jgi:4-hydroxybenzoate polyprenyltransferase
MSKINDNTKLIVAVLIGLFVAAIAFIGLWLRFGFAPAAIIVVCLPLALTFAYVTRDWPTDR